MIGAGMRGTPTPNPSPQGGGEPDRRSFGTRFVVSPPHDYALPLRHA
jgi:hypothetical protein